DYNHQTAAVNHLEQFIMGQEASSSPSPAVSNAIFPAASGSVLPGARLALSLLVLINLFNYIDRYVLAANLTALEKQLLPAGGANNKERLGDLTMAFMVSYMLFAPVFGWLAGRMARWKLVGIGVILWSLASGASGLAGTFHASAEAATGFHAFLGTYWF